MRSRTIREGSVGLLILLGVGLFVGLSLWLRGLTIGRTSFTAIIGFANGGGLQEGGEVRYRGVKVGNISGIQPGANGVEVEVKFTQPNLIIPRDVIVEANQSGLISEVGIDITPQSQLPTGLEVAKPLDENCDRTLIVCNRSRLQGQIGISFDGLIRSSTRFASIYSDPAFYNNLNAATKNAALAAAGVAQLTRDLSRLSQVTQQQLGNFGATATSVRQAANQISASTNQATNELGATAAQIRLTTAQVNRLVANLDTLVTSNRSALVTTLNSINQTSEQLRVTVGGFSPTLNRFTQGQIVENLETLSANAAQASANLRDVSNALNNPTNLLVLQQTLDSARVTFQNTQKITSDLDELTGDPSFRENLRQLVNGLSSLVSSTDKLEQEVQVAQTLDSLKSAVNTPNAAMPILKFNSQTIRVMPDVSSAEFSVAKKKLKPIEISP